MTSEQRLDRLERIAKLLVRAGLRARSQLRDQVDILMVAQLRNEERFAKLSEAHTRLIDSQVHTDHRLDALIAIIREGRQGSSN